MYVINGEHLTRRKLVTIDGSKVSTETAIPLMLNINLPGVKAAGADVRVAKLDGTPIAREIECKDVPNTDDVTIYYPWNTTASQNDQFYVYWGNSNLTEPAEDAAYGREAVWSSIYVLVAHMAQDPTGTILDSTSNDNDGTSYGTMTSGDLVNSAYGKAIEFDGTDDYIDFGSTGVPTGSAARCTLARIKLLGTPTPSYEGIIGYGVNTTNNLYDLLLSTARTFYFWGYSNDKAFTNSIAVGDTKTVGVRYASGASFVYLIDNGTTYSGAISPLNTSSSNIRVGADATGRSIYAEVSEARVMNTSPTDNYISTTHNNLLNPTDSGTTPFYLSFGETEHQRTTPRFI